MHSVPADFDLVHFLSTNWKPVIAGVIGVTAVIWALVRILRRPTIPVGFNPKILSFETFSHADFVGLMGTDFQKIKDKQKVAVLVYGVHDSIRDNAAKELRETILKIVPETKSMEDFFILAVVDVGRGKKNAPDFLKDGIIRIIKFKKLDAEFHKWLANTPIFQTGAMVLGSFG